MARLNWKSDALATVIRPLPKGTGDPPKRHLRGNNLKSRIEKLDSAFSLSRLCHPERKWHRHPADDFFRTSAGSRCHMDPSTSLHSLRMTASGNLLTIS